TQWFCDRSFRWLRKPADAKIDDVKIVETEIPEVVVSSIDQFLSPERGNPRFVGSSASTEFGHDDQAGGIGMQSTLDNLIGYMRAVIVAGVDVVHARVYRFAQNSHRGINVPWRPKNFSSGKLHGTVAHAVDAG